MFDIEDARNEYNAEFNGDPNNYDERYGDGEFCGSYGTSLLTYDTYAGVP